MEKADEDVNASDETIQKLLELIGGYRTLLFLTAITVFLQAYECYEIRLNSEFATVNQEDQQARYSDFMWILFIASVIRILIETILNFLLARLKQNMGVRIHQDTLEKIIFAPVNLFFDITPIGKVLRIFTGDISVFKGTLIDQTQHILNIVSHVIVMVALLVSFGSWEVTFTCLFLLALMVHLSKPWLHAEN